MPKGRLEILLANIAERTGLPVALDGNDSCAICYGEGFELALTSLCEGEEVLLHTPVQFVHPVDPVAQFRRCLEFSVYGTHSQGASVGIDPDGWITLWRRLPLAAIDGHRLEEEIVGFAASADALRSELAPGQPREAVGTAFVPAPGAVIIQG